MQYFCLPHSWVHGVRHRAVHEPPESKPASASGLQAVIAVERRFPSVAAARGQEHAPAIDRADDPFRLLTVVEAHERIGDQALVSNRRCG